MRKLALCGGMLAFLGKKYNWGKAGGKGEKGEKGGELKSGGVSRETFGGGEGRKEGKEGRMEGVSRRKDKYSLSACSTTIWAVLAR